MSKETADYNSLSPKEKGEKEEKNENFPILAGYLKELKKEHQIDIPEALTNRLKELEITKHNRDARVIYNAAFQTFHLIRKENLYPLKKEDLGPLLAASILHDIGKSGPADLPAKIRKTIIELYGLETPLHNHQRLDVGGQLKHLILQSQESGYYPARLAQLSDNLKQAGIDKEHSIRNFWQKHTQWTFDLLNRFLKKDNPLDQKIIKIAASHHYLEGFNPAEVNLKNTAPPEEEKRLNFLIKLLIVFDKYQGARRRGRLKPSEALEDVRKKIADKNFGQDSEFQSILEITKKIEEETGVFLLGAEIDAEIKK